MDAPELAARPGPDDLWSTVGDLPRPETTVVILSNAEETRVEDLPRRLIPAAHDG
ncbi:hypothetical protein [Streptomyces profundus]|uniref:hypothetical protein n=1 Tax=Streptomyces profundus TaxID=2867410 RepID=UPI001D168408|nr:hypothetical protein [Streptomyces sp. MA3_2.13]UED85803.1 hypothetical protein K4G22_17705 [Streptomyces sp. MA3_2.13]